MLKIMGTHIQLIFVRWPISNNLNKHVEIKGFIFLF